MKGSIEGVWVEESSRIKSAFRLWGRTVQRILALSCFGCLLTAGLTVEAAASPVTTGTLLDEMADLGRLARWPDPAYRTIQFSSYDRRSTTSDAPGWFSNADGFGASRFPVS